MPQVKGNDQMGPGVLGTSSQGIGVLGESDSFTGVGLSGTNFSTNGISVGIRGKSISNNGASVGVFGECTNGTGVHGVSPNGGVSAAGVSGFSSGANSNGVIGEANNGVGAYGVWGRSSSGFAGFFSGKVQVSGTLEVLGKIFKPAGGFRIDHPLDPENKYLSHSFVESPDMLNVYNGNVTTDANGEATVTLPDYFEALNQDFRYQLTVLGQFAQAMVAEEIKNNQFAIKTDRPDVKVSWQITGVRKDPFANRDRVLVEEDKPTDERGMYLHPEAHGKPEIQGVEYARGKGLKGP